MLVLFSPSPQSIIKAFLASRLHSARVMERPAGRRFYFEETLDADGLDYDKLYSEYKQRFGGLDFLEDEQLYEILENEIFWASRSRYKDNLQLVFKVLEQIERNGTKSYLAQESPEAKEMKDRIRRVTGELRRAKRYIAFAEDARNQVMIGRGSFEHNIVDLVLRYYAGRHPGRSIAVLDDTHAHILYKDEVLIDVRSRFPERPGRKDADRYWMLLSDPKHLEAKRDPEYECSHLPRNYWKWVGEDSEAPTRSSTVTLDDFPPAEES